MRLASLTRSMSSLSPTGHLRDTAAGEASGRSPLHDVKDDCELISELTNLVLFAADASGSSCNSESGTRLERSYERESCLQGCSGVGGARRDRTDDLLLAKQALSQLSYGPVRRSQDRSQKPEISNRTHIRFLTSDFRLLVCLTMVGLGRLELPTSRLSGVRSNRLSYRPDALLSRLA
jgi:hypothetical protein